MSCSIPESSLYMHPKEGIGLAESSDFGGELFSGQNSEITVNIYRWEGSTVG